MQWFTEDDFSKCTHENFVIFGRIFTVIVFYENFEMEVEQANFVTHFIISVQLHYFIWLSKNQCVKIWLNDFQMVMINHSKLYAS